MLCHYSLKYLWLFLVLLLSSCRAENSLDLVSVLPFAEKKADTEVLLFGAPKTKNFLSSWSEPRQQSGGKFRWSTGEQPSVSWTLALSEPSFLHFRIAADESFPMEVHFVNSVSSHHYVDHNNSQQVIRLPRNATGVELQIPAGRSLGVHSVVITPSREVAEFRKPKDFPFLKTMHFQGKNRNAIFCETGGSIAFYDAFSVASELEFGYYFVPSKTLENDGAVFSVLWTVPNGKERIIFQRRVTESVFRNVRIALNSLPYGSQVQPSKLEFRIERDTAFGNGQTAWIDPRVRQVKTPAVKSPSTPGSLRGSLADANVVFIILDAASVRHFGSYGYNKNTTPETDSLAKEGVQFQRAYTNAVYTLASSATILTGQRRLPSSLADCEE